MTRWEPEIDFSLLTPFEDIEEDIHKLHGEVYREIFSKVRRIIQHQFTNQVRSGIKGFLFWGDVGVGKTAMAKAVANSLRCPLVFVDGSYIARARYGESEQIIVDLFRAGGDEHRIILIDDAESVFPRRDWVKGESWHVAQNNVLFHEIDGLDTSKAAVILTTNEVGLMDRALQDRVYGIQFPYPPVETLIRVAKDRCEALMVPSEVVVGQIHSNPNLKSFRDVDKLVLDYYAEGTGQTWDIPN